MSFRIFDAGRLLLLLSLCLLPALARAEPPAATYKVGMRQVGWTDRTYGARPMVMTMYYPAAIADPAAKPTVIPFAADLHLYRDAPVAARALPFPLIMLSHGRGSNGLFYAWLGEYLAARGYIVAAPNHYRANTYDSSIVYLTTRSGSARSTSPSPSPGSPAIPPGAAISIPRASASPATPRAASPPSGSAAPR